MGIRASITTLKDPDDDYAFQILKGDVERLRIALEKASIVSGSSSGSSASSNITALLQQLFDAGAELITVSVCVDGVTTTMQVLGTQPL